ncbi:VENN motif pre-toxin domain-containing protein [Pantoea sp. Cy-640]|jgi:filamentous hemagglutinin|uniref:VENN motif pre-toxin domain-containing protein n=1 Tax=Pantoea sp. Cy-640 TaxID=2608353 RepID=UPI001FFC6513|nr:VENN motif pre-toxin domain-containing protein [Pantoea sp. Cy-640]
MVATAVAGALGGLSASNLGAAASGAMAPYIANAIKQVTTTHNADGTENVNLVANTMAHAVAGAVLAQMSGSSAAAGAAGASGGELAARAIVKVMYPNTDISSLSESQKQMVSTLSQLAAGLAGGIASDSSMGIGTGVSAGKNSVENNALCSAAVCLTNPLEANTSGGGAPAGAAIGVSAGTAIAESLKDDDSRKEPNLGHDISGEHKQEIAGGGGSSPNGWEPDEEDSKSDSKDNLDPNNRAQHEDYLDSLRASMEKPNVKDDTLKNLIDDLYRPNAKVGSGSTADAVRYELRTGEQVGGRGHIEKAETYSRALTKWLENNPNASPNDRAAAENVLKDMQNALSGK